MGIPVAALAVASLVTTAASAAYSGLAQKSAADYQAQVARNNATIQQQNATNATLAGEQSAVQAGQKSAAVVGAERAAYGASGIDVNSGSAENVQAGQEAKGELDQLTIRNNAARTAYGYQVNAMSDTAQANLDQMQGNNALAGSILNGASSVASKWYSFDQSGALGGSGSSGSGSTPNSKPFGPS